MPKETEERAKDDKEEKPRSKVEQAEPKKKRSKLTSCLSW